MNQKTIFTLVAIVATVGIVIVSSLSVPALAVEKDTKSNPNKEEVRSGGEGCSALFCGAEFESAEPSERSEP